MTEIAIKTKKGVIVSDKQDKTVVVSIVRVKTHPIYRKKFTVSTKIKAHDEENQYKTGEIVEIVECRPISRDKKFKVLRRIEK
ncbi:MAG: 30S ribosomal protein S17 [bacterium]